MLKGLRYKIFGQATDEDIKEFAIGFVMTAGVMMAMIIGLNLIGILSE